MKVSDIVKGTDGSRRIVKIRHLRRSRKQADLVATIAAAAEELRGLSRGVRVSEDAEKDMALNDVLSAVDRLKSVFSRG